MTEGDDDRDIKDLISKRIQVIGSQQSGPEYLYEALDFVEQGKVNDCGNASIGGSAEGLRARRR